MFKLALIVSLLVCPAAAAQPPEGWIDCYYSGGTITTGPVLSAYTAEGAIHYLGDDGDNITTAACIAHLPGADDIPVSTLVSPAILSCTDLQGEVVYYALVSQPQIFDGVWVWVDPASGDTFIASLPCSSVAAIPHLTR